MGEIVIAYAQADESAAELVMTKLKALGFSVKSAALAPAPRPRGAAPAPQIVLWSKHFAAAYAKQGAPARSALVTARLDTAPVSALLKSEAVDLRAWRGRDDHRGWKALVADIRAAAGAPGKASAKAPGKAPGKTSGKTSGKSSGKASALPSSKAGKAPASAIRAPARPDVAKAKGAAGPALFWLAATAAAAAGGVALYMQMH